MRKISINRGEAVEGADTWLTPPALLEALGKFDLDPCCPSTMPWSTARKMICLPEDGLAAVWKGRVWCNPPYSHILPWAEKLASHGNGIMLVPAKSTDTKWGQAILATADAVLFQKGRILFHYADGRLSTGKWSPYLLAAYGQRNVRALCKVAKGSISPGIVFQRVL